MAYILNKGRRGFSTRTAQLIRACKISKSHGLAVEATATIDKSIGIISYDSLFA